VKQFHRDRTAVADVAGEIDRRHAAAPEFLLKHIAVTQGVGEGLVDCSHTVAGRGRL
jgi:hypothetical protein